MPGENPYQSSNASDSGATSSRRKPWLLRSFVPGAIGFSLLFAAFVYGVVMVGVPSQDPTPQMARQEAFHVAVSRWGMAIGGGIVLLSVFMMLAVIVFRIATRRRA